ncbi:MAG: cytochrome c oxidase, subunit [Deltaproteobacteria bacterium]|nr:cytochrome c oxidase, subunit [Deltaproteobacteria bacterium]
MTSQLRSAAYVARLHLAFGALIVVAGLIGGLAMQLELWRPGALWGGDRYGRMFDLHHVFALAVAAPMLAGSFGYVAVGDLVGDRRLVAPALAWVGLALWLIGLGATVLALAAPPEGGWTSYPAYGVGEFETSFDRIVRVVVPGAFALAGLVYAVHLALVIVRRARAVEPAKLVIASAFVAAIALASAAALLDVHGTGTSARALGAAATAFAAVVLATTTLLGERASPHAPSSAHELPRAAIAAGPTPVTPDARATLALVAVVCAALWAFTPLRVLALATIGTWIALAARGGANRPVVAFVILGCAPAILGQAVVSSIGYFLHEDSFLFDTYFALAEDHVRAAIIALAALAALHAWAAPLLHRTPRPRLATAAAVACSAGMVLHVAATAWLGTRGMPRRYFDYDPVFTLGHQLAGIGGAIVVAGLGLLAWAWLGARRSQDPA